MRVGRPTDTLSAVVLGTLLLALGCTVEVNVYTNDRDADAAAPTAPTAPPAPSVDVPAPPAEPAPPAPPTTEPSPPPPAPPSPPRVVLPPPPAVTEPTPGVIRDALFRYREPEAPRDPAALAAEPTFTPFTQAPRILNREEIVQEMERAYPPLLREAGIGGTVRVYFFIDDHGHVVKSLLDQSSGHPALDQAAMRVAARYRFTAAKNGDRAVPVWVSFPITFQNR